MMTAKEKADELFWKYRPIIAGKQFVTGLVLMSEAKELTKQCALIVVDEIINDWINKLKKLKDETIEIKHSLDEMMELSHSIKYWNEVKQEIEKL